MKRRTRTCPHYKELYLKEKAKNLQLKDEYKATQYKEPEPMYTKPTTSYNYTSKYDLAPVGFDKITGQTHKAWCIQTECGNVEWFPKSQCCLAGPNTMMVPRWLLSEKHMSA